MEKGLIKDLGNRFYLSIFRLFVLVLGSVLIGTNMFSVKNIVGTVVYCCMIFAVIALLAIEIALYLLRENYIQTSQKQIVQKDELIEKYVVLLSEYKMAIRKKQKNKKKVHGENRVR